VGDFVNSTQKFDWNPGIEPSGLFWTMPIRDQLIKFDVNRGRARFRARHLSVPDYGTFDNSIASPPKQHPPIPSHVSFDTRWRGGGKRQVVTDADYDFTGTFVDGDITISFTAKHDRDDVVYRSDDGPQIVVSGGVGRERNGVFFP
jgi:hypothetical protein